MRRLFILINLILLLAVLMFLAGCSRAKDPKEISIGYVNWSEGIAMSYLAKAMLEEQGYKVTLKNADIAPIFTSVAAGKVVCSGCVASGYACRLYEKIWRPSGNDWCSV